MNNENNLYTKGTSVKLESGELGTIIAPFDVNNQNYAYYVKIKDSNKVALVEERKIQKNLSYYAEKIEFR